MSFTNQGFNSPKSFIILKETPQVYFAVRRYDNYD